MPEDDTNCVRPRDLAKEAGVRPQMVYNYISAGRIPAARCEEHEGTLCITKEDAEAWLTIRREKEQAKKDAIKRQLRGES